MIMDRKQFEAFMATLVPMKSHGDKKAINANYRKILANGFRCDRKRNCYTNGIYSITWKFVNGKYGEMVWSEI